MTFKPSSLDPIYEPGPEISTGEASFSGNQAGKVGMALFKVESSQKNLRINPEDYYEAFRTVIGEQSMADLLSVGWNQERLELVSHLFPSLNIPEPQSLTVNVI